MALLRRRATRPTLFLFTLVLLVTTAVPPAIAIAPVHFWSQRFGGTLSDSGYSLATDASGNVIVAGTFQGMADFGGGAFTSAGGNDIFLAKYDAAGSHLWSKRFGSVSSDVTYSVAVDASGNILLSGGFVGTVDFGGGPLLSAGSSDIFLAKYDAAGTHLWSRRFGSTSSDYCFSVAADASGNVLITGIFLSPVDFGGGALTSAGDYDIYLAKYDTDGTHAWSQRFGDIGMDYGQAVTTDVEGNVFLSGSFEGTVDFGGGPMSSAGLGDIYLAAYTPSGTHRWSRRFGGTGDDWGGSLAITNSGSVYVAGGFYDTVDFGGGNLASAGGRDAFLAAYDALGLHEWSRRFGGTQDESALGLAADEAGSVFLSGYFSQTGFFGNGYLASAGGMDAFLLKCNPAGAHEWSQRYGGSGNDAAYAVSAGVSKKLLVTGYMQQTVDFGGGPLSSAGNNDVFLLKIAADLPEPVITSITDVGNDQGRAVKILFNAAGGDDPEASAPVTRYVAFRRDDPAPAGSPVAEAAAPGRESALRAPGWIEVGSIGAFAEDSYGIVVPTIGDSTVALGQYFSVFFIRAATNEPSRFYDSPSDSGWSIDNLAPGVPASFAYSAGELTWAKSSAGDFDYFTVYGSATDSFGAAELVNYSVAPSMDVTVSPYTFYFVTATDFSGNEGQPARVNTLSNAGGTPESYVLSVSSYPNPFNPRTTVSYTVPSRGRVTVVVYDARGAHVATLFDGEREKGAYHVEWNGRGDGGAAAGSGVYFARIEHNRATRSKKMLLLK